MPNCKYTYSDLIEKYNNFHVPCIDIKIDGKKVKTLLALKNEKDKSLKISSLEVHLSMEKSSIANIKIIDVYNYSSSSIDEVATIGASIEILLGYGSSSKSVFYGYIAKIDYEFRGGFLINITALDAINLMEQESYPQYYVSKSYSDIINQIIGKYSSLIIKKTFDDLSITKEFVSREEKISDLQFIRRLCSECGKIFYISDGEAFITNQFDDKPIINLDIHELLREYKFSKMYQNCKVKVIGFDAENYDTEVSGESAVKIAGYKDATTAPQLKVVTAPNISKSADAKKYAETISKNILQGVYTGSVSCIGIPEIKIGKTITVSGVDKSTFDTYKFNISEVLHKIDASGFNTRITINGWS